MKRALFAMAVSAALAVMASAQTPGDCPMVTPGPGGAGHKMIMKDHIYMTHGAGGPGMMGRWWKNTEVAQKVGVSDVQVQRIEQIFQDHRLKLVDLHANLEKEEARLEPMMDSDQPDEGQIEGQIDRVAAARAELEKSHSRMLLDVRRTLTADQWKKLQSYQAAHPMMGLPPLPGQFKIQTVPAPPPGEME